VRDGGVQGIEAIVERQQRMAAERDEDRLLSIERTVDFEAFGPVGRSVTVRHFFPVTIGLTRSVARVSSNSLDYVVSLDGSPLSSWPLP
jgi:hypothetical protein